MGDISQWIRGARAGGPDAQRCLWECYFPQVLALARKKLGGLGGVADAEDVAASVLGSLLQGARAGRFGRLSNRHDLWTLLFVITRQKAVSLRRYRAAHKRSADAGQVELDELAGAEPPPEFEALFTDLIQGLFARLKSDELRGVARLRLEGWSKLEIGDQLGMAVRTVERKLQLIYDLWSRGRED